MSSFINYLNPSFSLEVRLGKVFFDEGPIEQKLRQEIEIFLNLLKVRDNATYEHSIRVGLLATSIGRFMHLNPRPLLFAGLLHDIGKAQTNPATLKKTEGWTEADSKEVEGHVMDGYRLIRGSFDFSAEIILWHHRFQPRCYPAEMPKLLHNYSEGTKVMIALFGRLLSLADQFDALHRVNDRFTAEKVSVGEWVKNCMLEHNPDMKVLIEELYKAKIFTNEVFD